MGGGWGLRGSSSGFPPGECWDGGEGVSPTISPAPIKPLIHQGGEGSPARGGTGARASVTVRSHCRRPLPFPLGGLRFCVFFLLKETEGVGVISLTAAAPTLPAPHAPSPVRWVGGLTEALLEPDSSSALGGCVAFFRLRGLDRAAFRRLLGGLVEESSYSSAREKRSLNLREGRSVLRVGASGPLTFLPCSSLSHAQVSISLQPHSLTGHEVCVPSWPPP